MYVIPFWEMESSVLTAEMMRSMNKAPQNYIVFDSSRGGNIEL